MRRPLDGIKVLDFSRVVAGPFAGRMLSDLGADVVKVEPPEGDLTRSWGLVRNGIPGFYQQQNAGKRNVCIDLKTPEGVQLAIDLAAEADIVLENFRAGVMKRLGLGWEVLKQRNPRLVMLSISGFGQEGPESRRGAFAPVIQAEAGFVSRQADMDGKPPTDPTISIADYFSGLHGLVGVLAALHQAQATGIGDYLDLSMVDVTIATDDYIHHAIDESEPDRLGGTYWQVADGSWILISSAPRHMWRQLSTTFGLSDGCGPEASLPEKISARNESIKTFMGSLPDLRAAEQAVEKAGMVWGELRTPESAIHSPTAVHRGVVAQVDDRAGGLRGVVNSPYRFADSASGVRGGAPHRGEHNVEVLQEWLGLDEANVNQLIDRGVLQISIPPIT